MLYVCSVLLCFFCWVFLSIEVNVGLLYNVCGGSSLFVNENAVLFGVGSGF